MNQLSEMQKQSHRYTATCSCSIVSSMALYHCKNRWLESIGLLRLNTAHISSFTSLESSRSDCGDDENGRPPLNNPGDNLEDRTLLFMGNVVLAEGLIGLSGTAEGRSGVICGVTMVCCRCRIDFRCASVKCSEDSQSSISFVTFVALILSA